MTTQQLASTREKQRQAEQKHVSLALLQACTDHVRRLRALDERAEKASAKLEQLARARDDYEAKYDVCSNRSDRYYYLINGL